MPTHLEKIEPRPLEPATLSHEEALKLFYVIAGCMSHLPPDWRAWLEEAAAPLARETSKHRKP